MDVIYSLMKSAYDTYDPNAISEYYAKESTNTKPKVMGSRYMSKRTYGYIRNKIHTKLEREYIFDNTRVIVEVYSINKTISLHLFYKILNFYIYALNKIVHKPVVKITIYMTNLKKQFPKSVDVILNEDNVNSGVTIFDGEDKHIIIYRKEELYKVLIHELIHYYKIDFHYYDFQHDKYFIEKYGIRVKSPFKNSHNPLALYEGYTDTLACYMNMITYSLFKERSLDELIKAETKYYLAQASKIYKFTHLQENTHCFSYYIIKAAMFHNFAKFLAFCDRGVVIDTNKAREEECLSLIKEVVEDYSFWQMLKKTRVRTIVLSSLKMSKIKW